MKLDELKERLVDEAKISLDRLQNSSLYIQLKEKFDELSPNVQKTIKYASAFFLVYFIFSFPIGWMNQASSHQEKYEANRKLIESLLQVQNDLKNSPNININISPNQLKSQLNLAIEKMGISKEQLSATEVINNQNRKLDFLPKNISYVGLSIKFSNLNLTQILDIGTKLQNLNPDAKLIEMNVNESAKSDHYYDVEYMIAGFTGDKS